MPQPSDKVKDQLLDLMGQLIRPAYTGNYSGLTDAQLDLIVENDEWVERVFYSLVNAVNACKRLKQARYRLAELDKRETPELLAWYKRLVDDGIARRRADVNDEASDSLYEPAPLGSDENVLRVILQKRGAIAA